MNCLKRPAFLLICAAVLLSFAACGGGGQSGGDGELLSINSQKPDITESAATELGDGRREIVLSVSNFDDFDAVSLSAAVIKFNKRNTDYKVVYGDFENDSVLDASVVSGKGPDIFVENGFDGGTYSSFAYEDLLPLLEADAEYGRGVYEESLLNALAKDGKINWLPVFYNITTFTGPEDILSSGRFTMEDAQARAAELGSNCYVFPEWVDRTQLLGHLVRFSAGKYVDWEAGTCDFNNPDFIALLDSCNGQVEAINPGADNTELQERKSLLELCYIYSVAFLDGPNRTNMDDGYMGMMTSAGSGYDYVGFPNEDSNGSMFNLGPVFAISASSKNKEGAWEFIRFVMSDEIQEMECYYIPVNHRTLEKQIELGIVGSLPKDYSSFSKFDREEADKFLKLLAETEYVEGTDGTIMSIIREEAAALFHGAKTAAEVAETIQSRVSIYVAERK